MLTRTGFRIGALERQVGIMQSTVETISPALVLLDAQGKVVSPMAGRRRCWPRTMCLE